MANREHDPKSLLSPQARGGDIAQGGFSFQDNLTVARVPGWLSRDGFFEMIRESLGDTEAAFFVPRFGTVRELLEAKNHRVAPVEFRQEVARFRTLGEDASRPFGRFELVCTELGQDVERFRAALYRVRDAFPFYEGAKAVQAVSFAEYLRAAADVGLSEEDARFIFGHVDITIVADADTLGLELFRSALHRHFPAVGSCAGVAVENAWQRLRSLVVGQRNVPIRRGELEAALWTEGLEAARLDGVLRLHTVRGEAIGDSVREMVVFEWEEFFGGEGRSFPAVERWKRLCDELVAARDWVVAQKRPRRVCFSGERRLSSAVAIGATFSAVSGFELECEYRGERYSSRGWGDGETYDFVTERLGAERADEVTVAIGVLRSPKTDVEAYLATLGNGPQARLYLQADQPLSSNAQVLRAVAVAKDHMSRFIAETGARTVHLFLLCPSHFAALLGHRLNATARIQCYEWIGAGRYILSCSFGT